jgi:LmbE family N-acetylglucosaminyl deacetylase
VVTFHFTRLGPHGKQRTTSLAEVLDTADLARETWLFISPHDDDLCIGAGLLMQAAVLAGVDVQVLIVTDGGMGYCHPDQIHTIAQVRLQEAYASFSLLGIPDLKVTNLGYPDSGLVACIGRRRANRDGEEAIAGHIGLQNAFTHYLRKFRPTRVFVPAPTDLHPDHRITYSELLISLFHASGAMWPELGPPLPETPKLGELAVYCDFAEPPNLEIIGDEETFRTKLASIEAYRSQLQIAVLVDRIRQAGAYEYVREVAFELYSPDHYKSLFA